RPPPSSTPFPYTTLFRSLNEAYRSGKTFLDPLTIKAELYALSVMGENSRMGVIVAAPTAGAGGVVPGMLLALEEERKIDPETTRSEEHTSELQSPYDLVC